MISKEQKDVILYILWNMVYVEGGTMIMGENPSNQYRRDLQHVEVTILRITSMRAAIIRRMLHGLKQNITIHTYPKLSVIKSRMNLDYMT